MSNADTADYSTEQANLLILCLLGWGLVFGGLLGLAVNWRVGLGVIGVGLICEGLAWWWSPKGVG